MYDFFAICNASYILVKSNSNPQSCKDIVNNNHGLQSFSCSHTDRTDYYRYVFAISLTD